MWPVIAPWLCQLARPLRAATSTRGLSSTSRRLQDPINTNEKTQDPLQAIKNDDAEKKLELSLLSRPLGVQERPTIFKKTRTQRMKELMEHDVRMEQRRHLIREASKGYFHDLNMTRRHGGKTWIAPKVLIREDKALYLPNVSGKSLDEGTTKDTTTMCFGRVTVLAMLGTKISELHAKAFTEPTHERFSSHPLYQYVQINLQENLLKSFLVNLFTSSLRSTVSKELQSNYLISSQNLEYVRGALGMTNSRVGYVYLIDENLKIRWGGCADPTTEEVQSLENCTGVLLKRLEKKPKMEVWTGKDAPTEQPSDKT
ncbi:hypothetical protein AX17_002545 [Amanita inopinata Kibby_2008]|nr:hypothetical protein AX17_002545 [Amanita inopinata Kibby_2008]